MIERSRHNVQHLQDPGFRHALSENYRRYLQIVLGAILAENLFHLTSILAIRTVWSDRTILGMTLLIFVI